MILIQSRHGETRAFNPDVTGFDSLRDFHLQQEICHDLKAVDVEVHRYPSGRYEITYRPHRLESTACTKMESCTTAGRCFA